MKDLSRRSAEIEEMDLPTTSPADYARALRDLAGVNRVTFTHRPVLRWLGQVTQGMPAGTRISVLDIACGHGDLLRAIHRWGQTRGFDLVLRGLDLNPSSAVEAAAATPAGVAIAWQTGDVFTTIPNPAPDFIVSSQFAHHLDDAQVVAFLQWLELHARRGWFISDLHRHVLPYYGFPLLARIMGWHRIVRLDGTISIARSFRRTDWTALAAQAGVAADIQWSMPFRYCVGHQK